MTWAWSQWQARYKARCTHVILPLELGQGDGVDVLVEDQTDVDRFRGDKEALGAERVRQDLDRVRGQQRGHGNVVETADGQDAS